MKHIQKNIQYIHPESFAKYLSPLTTNNCSKSSLSIISCLKYNFAIVHFKGEKNHNKVIPETGKNI